MDKFKRICIYPKDIQLVTGRSERYAREYYRHMRIVLQKDKHQFISLEEFCKYADLPIETVSILLKP